MHNLSKKTFLTPFALILAASIIGALLASCGTSTPQSSAPVTPTPTYQGSTPGASSTPSTTPTPLLPPVNPASVQGIASALQLTGISWVRVSYPTCGGGGPTGADLQTLVTNFHSHAMHVLLVLCQSDTLFATQQFNDVAQAGADAVECGNEQMKYDTQTKYITPADFARFYDLCSSAVHRLQPYVPVLMGSLDPHVGGIDIVPLYRQVSYLNQMQAAMNSEVHPGGNWQWRDHAIGLIDSWHNGYPDGNTNSLYHLFAFWADQFGVEVQSGALGQHLWVVEGTGCFKGCGLDVYNAYQIAVSHVLTLISDVQTSRRYHVPFFYFSAKDFVLGGILWPIGVLGLNGSPKPLRQDLPMGARALEMGCSSGSVRVEDQVQLLIKMYQGCSLPSNYIGILSS